MILGKKYLIRLLYKLYYLLPETDNIEHIHHVSVLLQMLSLTTLIILSCVVPIWIYVIIVTNNIVSFFKNLFCNINVFIFVIWYIHHWSNKRLSEYKNLLDYYKNYKE